MAPTDVMFGQEEAPLLDASSPSQPARGARAAARVLVAAVAIVALSGGAALVALHGVRSGATELALGGPFSDPSAPYETGAEQQQQQQPETTMTSGAAPGDSPDVVGGDDAVAAGAASGGTSSGVEDDSTSYTLGMKIWTKYIEMYGEPGRQYPWVSSYDGVVEPWRDSWLIASCEDCSGSGLKNANVTFRWTFDDGEVDTGKSVVKAFTQLNTYTVELALLVDGVASGEATFSLVCRYVRREMRELLHEDRELFLETMHVLWHESSSTGRQKYGAAYTDVYDLAAYHTELASDILCDHMHDGLGFLTQHIALSLAFEQSMQAVNPRVTLPFWDFTIDKHLYDVGNWSTLGESPMWTSEWFGTAKGDYDTVTEGRWAYIQVKSNVWGNSKHNSYGFMRAPWNNNNRPYVTRKTDLCGIDYISLPSCEVHWYTLDKTHSWYDFGWVLPYEPHGPVHMYVGGALNCNSTMSEVLDYLESLDLPAEDLYWHQKRELEYLLRTDMFLSLKNMYRASMLEFPSYCSIDTPFLECHGTCQDMDRLEQTQDANWETYVEEYWSSMFAWSSAVSHYTWLDYDVKVKIVQIICSLGIGVDGDQLEAGSPMDPSFWPIHPTMERLWIYKKITGTLDTETWPKSGFATSDCYGHNKTDIVPFQFALKTTGDSTSAESGTLGGASVPTSLLDTPVNGMQAYTNEQIYSLASPDTGLMPYIYGDFSWHHCIEEGWDMSMAGRVPVDDDSPTYDTSTTTTTTSSTSESEAVAPGDAETASDASDADAAADATADAEPAEVQPNSRSSIKDIRKRLRNIQIMEGVRHMWGSAR